MKKFVPVIIPLVIISLVIPSFAQYSDSTTVDYEQQVLEQLKREELTRRIKDYNVIFSTIYREINGKYVDDLDHMEFLKAGIDGMLSTLDPYTEYFEREETDDLNIITKGKYGGIGIQIGLRGPDRELTIIAPIEGTPGWKLGLRPGDRIVKIEDESTRGFTTFDAAQRMRGEEGTIVNISVLRPGVEDTLDFAIERAIIPVIDVSYAGFIDEGIGYIRLTRFSRNAGKQVKAKIDSLDQFGLDALIFDMRGNPGGLLPQAISVAENFLEPGSPVVSTKGRIPTANREFEAQEEPSLNPDIPLVVLVNEGSASASEIVAGAVQDLDRGVIIGRTTFGKGLVQSVMPFHRYETSLKLTTAKYFTPSGRLIQKIDYFDDNDALMLDTIYSEESKQSYFTRNGREVNAHGGIQPDFDIELPEVGYAVIELWRQGKFFDFVSFLKGADENLSDWTVTSEIEQSFFTYLDTTDFSFETEAEKQIAKIREDAEEFEYSDEFMEALSRLEAIAEETRQKMVEQERDEILKRIKVELASIIGGTEARVEASFEFDPQIAKAIEILKQSNIYAATLTEGAPEAEE